MEDKWSYFYQFLSKRGKRTALKIHDPELTAFEIVLTLSADRHSCLCVYTYLHPTKAY